MRSVVVLPQPDGPTRTTNSLSLMVRFALSTALTPPSYTFEMFLQLYCCHSATSRGGLSYRGYHRTNPARCQSAACRGPRYFLCGLAPLGEGLVQPLLILVRTARSSQGRNDLVAQRQPVGRAGSRGRTSDDSAGIRPSRRGYFWGRSFSLIALNAGNPVGDAEDPESQRDGSPRRARAGSGRENHFRNALAPRLLRAARGHAGEQHVVADGDHRSADEPAEVEVPPLLLGQREELRERHEREQDLAATSRRAQGCTRFRPRRPGRAAAPPLSSAIQERRKPAACSSASASQARLPAAGGAQAGTEQAGRSRRGSPAPRAARSPTAESPPPFPIAFKGPAIARMDSSRQRATGGSCGRDRRTEEHDGRRG